jgi:hypothetical protein
MKQSSCWLKQDLDGFIDIVNLKTHCVGFVVKRGLNI